MAASPGSGKAIWASAIMNIRRERNPYFVGRDQILSDIKQAFDESTGGKTLALVGMGGAGKTSLALEYAYARKLQYDLIWWLDADSPARIAAGMAALAQRLGLPVPAQTDLLLASRAAVTELHGRDGWLLVFDNAQYPDHLSAFIPWGGAGHIIITSRNTQWEPMARPIAIAPWARNESIDFLHKRLHGFKDDAVGGKLAAALGDLPLALEQAAACIEQTKVSASSYLRHFENYWGELLQRGTAPGERPNFAAMAWELSFRQVESTDPAAAALLNFCSFLGTAEIPLSMLRNGAALLPEPLSDAASIPSGLTSSLATLRQFSLAETPEKGVAVHPLIAMQARQRMSDADRMRWVASALNVASQDFPFDSQNHETWQQCARSLPHVLAAADHASEGDAPAKALIDVLDRAGKFLLKQGQWAQARLTLERALKLVSSTYGARSPRFADIANNLGRARHRMGDFANAMDLYESAMQIDGVLYGTEDPHMAAVANNFGMTLAAMGKLQPARERFEHALRIYQAHFGSENVKVASVMNNLGYVLTQLKDWSSAQLYLQKSLEIAERIYGQGHPNVARIIMNLADVFTMHERLDEAGHFYARALAIDEKAYGPDHLLVARDLLKYGKFLANRGDFGGAVQHLDRAVRIAESAVGPNNPRTVDALNELGKTFTAAGNAERAAECFVEATRRSRKPEAPAELPPEAETAPVPAAAAAFDEGALTDDDLQFREEQK